MFVGILAPLLDKSPIGIRQVGCKAWQEKWRVFCTIVEGMSGLLDAPLERVVDEHRIWL